jgi:hypothetical protein
MLVGDRLLVLMGNILVALKADNGEVSWEYSLAPKEEEEEEPKAAGGQAVVAGGGAMMGGGMMGAGAEAMMPGAMGGEMPGGMPGGDAMMGGAMGGDERGGRRSGRRGDRGSGRRSGRGGRGGRGERGGEAGGDIGDIGAGGGGGGRVQDRTEREELKYEENFAASVVAVEGAVYVLSDAGALYAMGAGAVDVSPPEILHPLLDVPSTEEQRMVFPLEVLKEGDPDDRYADEVEIPGSPSIYMSALCKDEGSGVNPDSIVLSLNGKTLEHIYDPVTQLLWWLHEPRAGAARNIQDGLQKIEVRVSDWRGQQAMARFAFKVDNALPPPEAPKTGAAGGAMPGMEGGPMMMPGMPGGGPAGEPGMMPGMPGMP